MEKLEGLPDHVKSLRICLLVLIQNMNVMDRRIDRQTDRQTPHDCTGCAYAERCATKTKPDQLSLERDNHGTESSNGG